MASSSQKSAAEVNLLGKRKVEDGLETKSMLKRHKEKSEEETTKEQIEASVELSERKSDEANLTDFFEEATVETETVEGVDETPEFSKEAEKSVFVGKLPRETEISDIIEFFKDIGQVVRVRLETYPPQGLDRGAFVEFASANQAKKALEKKQGQYLHNRKIFPAAVAIEGTRCFPPKYCIDHKVWYEEDYLEQQDSHLRIEKDPNSVKESAVLFVANLSPQTTKLSHITLFFEDVGDVVSVRLIVNQEGKHVGYGFVEFATAHQAKWALQNKNGEYLHDHKIFLMQGLDGTPDSAEAVAIRNKTLFVTNLSPITTKISHIINFFKDVGQVVHVRLIVDQRCRMVGFGFVEFASANEAEKALEKKKGEYLHNRKIALAFAKTDADTSKTKYCLDHMVWYEYYLEQREIEDAAVEGLDFVEDVALRKKTVFVAKRNMKKSGLKKKECIKLFKVVGEVVRVGVIVDHWGEHVGCCFVEFASADEAKKAVQVRNGYNFFVNVAEIDRPYPFRLNYKLAEKLWYEDNLRREGFSLPIKSKLREAEPAIFCGKKITLSDKD